MSIRNAASNLAESFKELHAEWQRTRESWHDVKSREFQDAYLELLPQQIARATAVMEELDAVLRKIKTDCE